MAGRRGRLQVARGMAVAGAAFRRPEAWRSHGHLQVARSMAAVGAAFRRPGMDWRFGILSCVHLLERLPQHAEFVAVLGPVASALGGDGAVVVFSRFDGEGGLRRTGRSRRGRWR